MLTKTSTWNPKKRIIKVLVPYVFWTFLYVLMYNSIKTISIIPIIFLKSLLTGSSERMMYYIFVYCEFTLLTPLIDKIGRSKFQWCGFLISPLEIIFMRLIPLAIGYDINPVVVRVMGVSCLGWFTYYYLGYLLGNGLIKVKSTFSKLICLYILSILLQIIEGGVYFSMGVFNCGTQLKLTAILSGVLFSMIAFKLIESGKQLNIKSFKILGDYSFGIYFVHVAIMNILESIPGYISIIVYPLNAIMTIIGSLMCVSIGHKILGKYGKFLAF